MAYNLGAVGFGHWFERLYAGMARTDRIRLAKVTGVSDIGGKASRLKLVGIGKDNYYRMQPDAPIPKEFFSVIVVFPSPSDCMVCAAWYLFGLDMCTMSRPEKNSFGIGASGCIL